MQTSLCVCLYIALHYGIEANLNQEIKYYCEKHSKMMGFLASESFILPKA